MIKVDFPIYKGRVSTAVYVLKLQESHKNVRVVDQFIVKHV